MKILVIWFYQQLKERGKQLKTDKEDIQPMIKKLWQYSGLKNRNFYPISPSVTMTFLMNEAVYCKIWGKINI